MAIQHVTMTEAGTQTIGNTDTDVHWVFEGDGIAAFTVTFSDATTFGNDRTHRFTNVSDSATIHVQNVDDTQSADVSPGGVLQVQLYDRLTAAGRFSFAQQSAGALSLAQILAVGADANATEITNVGAATTDSSVCILSQARRLASAAVSPVALFCDMRPDQTRGGGPSAGAGGTGYFYSGTLTRELYNYIGARVSLQQFSVAAFTAGTPGYIYVTGDQTAHIDVGRYISLYGDTGYNYPNAAVYPLIPTTVTYNAGTGRTKIEVATLSGSVVGNGTLYTGRVAIGEGTYDLEASGCFYTNDGIVRLAERTGFSYTSGRVSTEGSKTVGYGMSAPAGANVYAHLQTRIVVSAGAVEYWEIQKRSSGTGTGSFGEYISITGFEERFDYLKVTRITE